MVSLSGVRGQAPDCQDAVSMQKKEVSLLSGAKHPRKIGGPMHGYGI